MHDLAEAARVINDAHERCQKAEAQCHDALRNANEAALEVGRRLLAVKEQLPYGEFENWKMDNCIFGVRQAQRYALLAKHEQQLGEWMPGWTGLLTPTAAMHEAANFARKAKSSKSADTEQADPEDELEAHETRVETFNSLVDDLFEIDGEESVLQEAARQDFQADAEQTLAKLSLRHAKRLCKKHEDKDPVLTAMLLVHQLKEQLDPARIFAPEGAERKEPHATAALPADQDEVGELLEV